MKSYWSRGGGLVVSMLANYFDDPSVTPLKFTVFSVKCKKRTKRKRCGREPWSSS